MAFDFKDFYIGYKNHPKFQVNKIIEDDILRVIIQKYEMIIFTNKGELFGDPNFGCDLINFLHNTKVSDLTVKNIISAQIRLYIPEMNSLNYTLDVNFYDDPENYQDIMVINLIISDIEVQAIIV